MVGWCRVYRMDKQGGRIDYRMTKKTRKTIDNAVNWFKEDLEKVLQAWLDEGWKLGELDVHLHSPSILQNPIVGEDMKLVGSYRIDVSQHITVQPKKKFIDSKEKDSRNIFRRYCHNEYGWKIKKEEG